MSFWPWSTLAEVVANSRASDGNSSVLVEGPCCWNRNWMRCQNDSAKLRFIPGGYSFAAEVRKLPSSARPMSWMTGFTRLCCSLAAKVWGMTTFAYNSVVGFTPNAPCFHCLNVYCRKGMSRPHNSLMMAVLQIDGRSIWNGGAGCSKATAPPPIATQAQSCSPFSKRLFFWSKARECIDLLAVHWRSSSTGSYNLQCWFITKPCYMTESMFNHYDDVTFHWLNKSIAEERCRMA